MPPYAFTMNTFKSSYFCYSSNNSLAIFSFSPPSKRAEIKMSILSLPLLGFRVQITPLLLSFDVEVANVKSTKHRQQDKRLAYDLVQSIEAICLNVVDSWSSSLSSYNHQKSEEAIKSCENKVKLFLVNPLAEMNVYLVDHKITCLIYVSNFTFQISFLIYTHYVLSL